jgi:transposase-like protein
MNREGLEKLSKDELIDMLLAMQEGSASKIAELEARLNTNSANSSMPPSSDSWKRPPSGRRKSGKKPGGQLGHKGHGLKIDREPDETVLHKPPVCERCGLDIGEAAGSVSDSRYKIDIAIRTVLTRHDQVRVGCPACDAVSAGSFPESLKSRVQYGEGVRAISVLLTNYAMVGYDKTQKLLNDVFGVPLSAGTVVNHVKKFSEQGQAVVDGIAEKLKQSSVLNFDESGVRVNGTNQWLHTASNSEATYSTVHPKRGKAGIDDNGVLQSFTGVAVHDCWKPYFSYRHCTHALCNAHLLRELQGVIDNTSQVWAGQMQDLLRAMKRVVDRYKAHGKEALSKYYQTTFAESYGQIVRLGEQENPLADGQRKRGKPRCLLDRFIAYKTEICRFADNFAVPFDNNQAERDIRNVKVKQKVSGGFRSDEGAKSFGKISSVIGTSIKQGMSAFDAVSGIIAGSISSLFKRGPLTE